MFDIHLELHPFAAVHLDTFNAITAYNRRWQDLLVRRPELFRSANNRLTLADGDAQRALTRRLSVAGPASAFFTIRISDPDRELSHWLVVRTLPEPDGADTTACDPAARRYLASFRLTDEADRLFDGARLAEALGLTPAEAELAAALTQGYSVREYAAREGVEITTVRWHLRNARRKLGCASQKELIRTVLLVCV